MALLIFLSRSYGETMYQNVSLKILSGERSGRGVRKLKDVRLKKVRH